MTGDNGVDGDGRHILGHTCLVTWAAFSRDRGWWYDDQGLYRARAWARAGRVVVCSGSLVIVCSKFRMPGVGQEVLGSGSLKVGLGDRVTVPQYQPAVCPLSVCVSRGPDMRQSRCQGRWALDGGHGQHATETCTGQRQTQARAPGARNAAVSLVRSFTQ